jgi:hypothetical protein
MVLRFFVPEGHVTVARRFIDLSPGPEAYEARVPEGRPNTAAHAQAEDPPLLKLNRFSHEISIVPPGREQILNASTGDKSPAYFLVVPPGHTATATALNTEMCIRELEIAAKFSLSSRHSGQTPLGQTRGTPKVRRDAGAARDWSNGRMKGEFRP